jgi:two-component system, OmpR family, sensor histidine kinase VicK
LEILYDSKNALEKAINFMQNTKVKMDIAFDRNAPYIVVDNEDFLCGFKDILTRGGKIRCITEVTSHNVLYCKELLNLGIELCHLNDFQGGFVINESEYMTSLVFPKGQLLERIIYSDEKEMSSHGEAMFENLWKNAVPASIKIKEVEDGRMDYETKIISVSSDPSKVRELGTYLFDSDELNICTNSKGLRIGYRLFLSWTKDLLERKKKGQNKGIRILTVISNENLDLVKQYLDLGVEIRHLKESPFINFGITESHMVAAIENSTDNNFINSVLCSNDPSYLHNFKTLFDKLWKNSKQASEIIKSIDEEKEIPFIETIEKSDDTLNLIKDLIASANQEILGIFPTVNSFMNQIESGFFTYLKNVTQSKDLSIKILVTEKIDFRELTNINKLFKDELYLLQDKREFYAGSVNNMKPYDFTINQIRNIKIRSIANNDIQSEIGLLIADRSKSIIVEFKNSTLGDPSYSIGLASYSNSVPISNSYAFIFDSLWNQSELYQFLKKIYNRLKTHDKMQREFIDVVAHELRTPVQPMIGLTEYVKDNLDNKKQKELLEIVINSAQKLHTLAENILTVTKIEGKLFNLSKSTFNLTELVIEIVKNFEITLENKIKIDGMRKKKIKFVLVGFEKRHIVIADKVRISQVISNLIDNSVNFIMDSKNGIITITIEAVESSITVKIKDNGEGIHTEILPRLFSKFATKSFYGTGLGLYICRNIIIMHGGKIWAENNKDGMGATISFTLPQ